MGFKSGLSHSCLNPFQCCFCCKLGVIVLLERKSSPQSRIFCTLKQVLLKDLPAVDAIHCSLHPYKSPNHCCCKSSTQHDTATTMHHGRDGVRWVMRYAWFETDVMLCIQAKEFNFHLIRPENLFPHALRIFRMTFCKLQGCYHKPFSQVWLPTGDWHSNKLLSTNKTSMSSFMEHCSQLWTGSLASHLAQLNAMERKAFKINGIAHAEAEYMGLSTHHRRQVSACYEVWTGLGVSFSGRYICIYVVVCNFRSEAMHWKQGHKHIKCDSSRGFSNFAVRS